MKEITYAQAINEAISEEMRRDENVFMMGEDIGLYCGAFGVSRGMIQEFGGDRIMDTPIAEQAYVGAGVGAAMCGMRPIVELMFSDFMCVCFDELVNEAAKLRFMFGGKVKVPMVMRTASGAGTGAAAQHSQSLEACLAHFPGLKVVIPSTPYDAKGLLKTAIRVRLHRGHLRAHGQHLSDRCPGAGKGWRAPGGHRHPLPGSPGYADYFRICKKDQARADRP